MRRLLSIGVLAVLLAALPSLAGAAEKAPRDGTLSIEGGKGFVELSFKGALIGRFAKGSVTITDLLPWDDRAPFVWGEDLETPRSFTTTTYSGENVRFRVIGGSYTVKIRAVGIDLSAVGRGRLRLQAKAGVDNPGKFALNTEEYRPLPEKLTPFLLEPPPVAPG